VARCTGRGRRSHCRYPGTAGQTVRQEQRAFGEIDLARAAAGRGVAGFELPGGRVEFVEGGGDVGEADVFVGG
jgi:hypothetical protein